MKTIHAKSCEVATRSIEDEEVLSFVEEHHRQGMPAATKSDDVVVLLWRGQIVGVSVFCSPRTSEKRRLYHKELLRMCFPSGLRVLEGASTMVNYYRKHFTVYDLFTYQDTIGKVSRVYEHCGFTLVKANKTKSYLVAPHRTLATASRREALGMAYATRYGPDRILGTCLGEVYTPEGRRKSNRELFLEELGWHEETTTGDRVYEWVNPAYTFYTYRITAADSGKYYYGVSPVKRGGATPEECAQDGYMGSGGPKFSHWRGRHKLTLTKTIVGVFARRGEALAHEAKLVGTRHQDDPLCLNSRPGGVFSGGSFTALRLSQKQCSKHGLTNHRGQRCLRCLFMASIHLDLCPQHGLTKHQGTTCLRCKAQAYQDYKLCERHGLTIHRGIACMACSAEGSYRKKQCAKHGVVTHRGERCVVCVSRDATSRRTCPTHGESTFQGDTCLSCVRARLLSTKDCPTHGPSLFLGESCQRCGAQAALSRRHCPVHGESTFRGETCVKCSVAEAWTWASCPTHGETKFFGGACWSCKNAKQVTEGVCPKHGRAKFIGARCYKCTNQRAIALAVCPTHGESKHQGGRCCKCAQAKRFALRECPKHGLVKHNGKSCCTCTQEHRAAKKR